MFLKTKTLVILVTIFTSVVTGVPRPSEDVGPPDIEVSIDDAQRLLSCTAAHQYLKLSHFDFNPRAVPLEDTACLSLRMFKEMGFTDRFNISVDILSRFILRAQTGYHDVPYHNWQHGFAVLHFSFAVLKNCQLIEKHHFTPLEGLALLTAAMCHDIDHRGTNNQFQNEVNSPLAQKYGEHGSIMERHHIAYTLGILTNSETNFVSHLDENKLAQFKDLIKHIILATDLSVHFKLLPEEKTMVSRGFDKSSDRDRELLRSVIISCADLSDQTKDWATVREVAKLIYAEFFAQGDREKSLGLTPKEMMDRSQAKIPQSQVDFLSHVVIPDYKLLLTLYPETQPCLDNVQQNLVYWRQAIPYFEEQLRHGRKQLDILTDSNLNNISNWSPDM